MCCIYSVSAPEIPTKLNITTINSTSIKLTWGVSVVLISQYMVAATVNNTCTHTTHCYNLTDLVEQDGVITHHSTELQPYTHYCFTLAASNLWGVSEFSEEQCTSTPADGRYTSCVCVCALCVYMHVYTHCMCVCVTYIHYIFSV